MSTSSFAAAALLRDDDCLAAAAGDDALHGSFVASLPLVTGGVCLVSAARHGEARGRSDLLDDVVVVDDVVHAVVLDVQVVVVVGFVLTAHDGLPAAVMETVSVTDPATQAVAAVHT